MAQTSGHEAQRTPRAEAKAEPVPRKAQLQGHSPLLAVATQGSWPASDSVSPCPGGELKLKCSSGSRRPGVPSPGLSASVIHASLEKARAQLADSPMAGGGPTGPESSNRLRQQPLSMEPGD